MCGKYVLAEAHSRHVSDVKAKFKQIPAKAKTNSASTKVIELLPQIPPPKLVHRADTMKLTENDDSSSKALQTLQGYGQFYPPSQQSNAVEDLRELHGLGPSESVTFSQAQVSNFVDMVRTDEPVDWLVFCTLYTFYLR